MLRKRNLGHHLQGTYILTFVNIKVRQSIYIDKFRVIVSPPINPRECTSLKFIRDSARIKRPLDYASANTFVDARVEDLV